jgi:hypothetical protein
MTYNLEPWPRWITLFDAADGRPAVRVLFARPSRSLKRRAQRAAAELLGEIVEGEERDPFDLADAGDAFSEDMLRRAILDWEGIGDAKGKVLPVTPESIELFIADQALLDRADELYVLPELRRDAEKNASSALSAGTGRAATPESATASSAAPERPKAKAKAAATNAHTSSTRRAAKRAKASGT